MKKYKLLKDYSTPDLTAKAGDVGELGINEKVWFDNNRYFFFLSQIKMHPSWFEELVTEPSMPERINKGMEHGLYLITWTDEQGGGNSLASVGFTHDGSNWYAPCNWTSKDNKNVIVASTDWSIVKSFRLILKNDYETKNANVVLNDTVVEEHGELGKNYFSSTGEKLCPWSSYERLFEQNQEILERLGNSYSQEQVDAIMEDTWHNCRKINIDKRPWFVYKTLADYKATLPLQQVQEDKPVQSIKTALDNNKPYGRDWEEFLLPDQMEFLHRAFKEYATDKPKYEGNPNTVYTSVRPIPSTQPEAKDKPFVITDEFVKLFLMSNSIGDTQLNNWEKFKQSNHVPKQSPTLTNVTWKGVWVGHWITNWMQSLQIGENLLSHYYFSYWTGSTLIIQAIH